MLPLRQHLVDEDKRAVPDLLENVHVHNSPQLR